MYSSEQNTLIMKMNAASYPSTCNMQGDHSPDNVKFPDISMTVCSTALLCGTRHVKCYSYHVRTSVTVSSGGRNATVHDL